MSAPILESYIDERGNISVRASHDVQVLTREEADRIEAEYKRMQTENAKLRELALALADCRNTTCDDCVRCDPDGGCSLDGVMRELGIEVGG